MARPVRALAIVAVAALVALTGCGDDGDDGDVDGGGAGVDTEAIEGLVLERVGDYTHELADLDYPTPAPSGGDHTPPPYWLTCGVYDGAVPDELAVHSLEHGAVWIALGPTSTTDDRAAAEALAAGERVIVSDVADLPNPVELVAWGVRLPLASADDGRAAAFVAQFVDRQGGAPEAGASCESLGEPPTPPTLPSG